MDRFQLEPEKTYYPKNQTAHQFSTSLARLESELAAVRRDSLGLSRKANDNEANIRVMLQAFADTRRKSEQLESQGSTSGLAIVSNWAPQSAAWDLMKVAFTSLTGVSLP